MIRCTIFFLHKNKIYEPSVDFSVAFAIKMLLLTFPHVLCACGRMNLESYVGQYTFADILAIEQSDRQFIALQQAWNKVSDLGMSQELFVYLVVECALISFQVAGSGPDRWE